jgi:multiple sugar transport system permease protein
MSAMQILAGRHLAIALLSLPALTGMLIFLVWPLAEAAWISLFNYNLLRGTGEWRGLGNYAQALADPLFRHAMQTSVLFFVLKVPLQLLLGFGLALFVRGAWRGVGLVRTVVLVPTVTSMVVVATIWGLMYDPSNGLFASILQTAGLPAQPFLTSPAQALPAIAAMMIWRDVGFTMILFLAGLSAIPRDYYEAAMIDGASGLQIARSITVPLLKRTTVFILIVETIAAFKVLTPVLLLTNGGPANAHARRRAVRL